MATLSSATHLPELGDFQPCTIEMTGMSELSIWVGGNFDVEQPHYFLHTSPTLLQVIQRGLVNNDEIDEKYLYELGFERRGFPERTKVTLRRTFTIEVTAEATEDGVHGLKDILPDSIDSAVESAIQGDLFENVLTESLEDDDLHDPEISVSIIL